MSGHGGPAAMTVRGLDSEVVIVPGADGDIVEAELVSRWAAGLDEPPDVEIVPGAGHVFHDQLSELGHVVEAYLADTPLAAGASSC